MTPGGAIGWPLEALAFGFFIGGIIMLDPRRGWLRTQRGTASAILIITGYACFLAGMVFIS